MELNTKQYGFDAELYLSERPWDEQKVVIVCGGSDGDFSLTKKLAKNLCNQGIHTLALKYINAPGLPKHTIEAPVETAIKAVNYLKSSGYHKIGIYGISSGGEYALIAATYTTDITNVIAINAPTAISQADNGIVSKKTSCWSWEGRPFSYIPVGYSLLKALPKSLAKRELYTAHFYEQSIKYAKKEAWIEVEKINGPVLFLTAEHDSICSSDRFAKIAIERLEQKKFAFRHEQINYKYASHFLFPVEHSKDIPTSVIAIERKYADECARSRADSMEKSVAWLKSW